MAHNTTVFRQLLDLLPRHEFDAEARRHQKGQRLRVMSRWAQFVALGLGQLAGLQSLRDIVGSLRAQPHKLYHLGVRAFVSRSSLARVNTEQPYTLYETLFGRLLARCQQRAPRQQASGSRTSCSRWSSAARARRRHPDRGDERPDDRVDQCARSQGLSGDPASGRLLGRGNAAELRVRDEQHDVGGEDDCRPVQIAVADRTVFQSGSSRI